MKSGAEKVLRIILNGKSSGNEAVRSAVKTIRAEGFRVEVRVTWEFGDAARFADEALRDGVQIVVAAGGDGTVNEVIAGLIASESSHVADVAILPLGTANDFATACGIPTADPLAALRLAVSGSAVPIDIGQANDDYFVNIASGGFGAEVTVNTPKPLKKALGGAAYAIMGFANAAKLAPRRCVLTLPDGESHEGDVYILAVGNGRQAGGGQPVCPRAVLNDGLLDLLVVHDVKLMSFGNLINEWLSLGDDSNQSISYLQLESFRIQSDESFQINLDGEPVWSNIFDFRAIPNAIRLVLPSRGAPLKAD